MTKKKPDIKAYVKAKLNSCKRSPDRCYDIICELTRKAAKEGLDLPTEHDISKAMGRGMRATFSYTRELEKADRVIIIKSGRQKFVVPNDEEFIDG